MTEFETEQFVVVRRVHTVCVFQARLETVFDVAADSNQIELEDVLRSLSRGHNYAWGRSSGQDGLKWTVV